MGKWFKPGDYRIIDERSGEEIWASEATYDWDGSIRRVDDLDGEHPDWLRRHYPEEKIPEMTNDPGLVTAFSSVISVFVGLTSVTAQPLHTPNRFID